MSEQVTAAPPVHDGPLQAPGGRRERVRRLVADRARRLAESRDRSATVAMLARLRGNVGRSPGTDPAIWAMTVDGVSPQARGDDATPEERAVHLALTLFATHQQSRPNSVHLSGVGFGLAVARLDRLAGAGEHEGPSRVRRRFDAVVTSASFAELTHHLRGLIGQMRSAEVGLDYGLLAQDLWDFQQPGRADAVRRQWARQYYRHDPTDPAGGHSVTDTPEEQQ